MTRPRIRERYSTVKPVQVPDDVKAVLGRWFTAAELQWAEAQFRGTHPQAPEPVGQVLYLRPRVGR